MFAGSRADSPELPETEARTALSPAAISPSQSEEIGKGGRDREEETTVGGGRASSRAEEAEGGDEKLTVIPEETYGGEEGECAELYG